MPAPVTLYGIANCDTIKKARAWLTAHDVAYDFHDYRKQGLDPVQLKQWADLLGWQALLNTRGTTWRQLPAETRAAIDQPSALALMLDNPAIIKRPLLLTDGHYHLGFSIAIYSEIFAK